MDTNNLQQINNFADGMNTDTSDAVLSESSYRLANNLRFITNTDENSGELHMIEGASITNYDFNGETIIGTTNLRDVPIFITQTSNQHWKVYYGDKCVADIPAENNRVIGHAHKLSLVTRWEDEQNQKLYIADGEGPVIVINLTPKDKLTELNQVVSYPSVLFKKPIFCGLIDGNIKAAVVEYSYQFYKKYGQQSEISPSTKLIPLYKGATTAKESARILGYLPDEQPDKGVKIKIKWSTEQIEPFDRIKVFRVSYIETGQLPQIECIYDENIQGEELILEDSGQTALQVFSLEEYNSMTGIHIIPKTIESKDDYLFAANVEDASRGFDIKNWSPSGNVELTLVTVDLVGDDSINPGYVVSKPTYHNYSGQIVEQKILGNSIQTSDGTFYLDDYVDTHYTDNNNNVQDGKDVLSYHNPQVSYMFKSLRRGEKYRFGIIFYDKYGRSSGVVHLQDVEVDKDEFFEVKDGQLIVKPKGIKFEIIGSLPEGTVTYEIVRCGRSISDISTITQGILSRPIAREYTYSGIKESYPLTPTGFVTIHDIFWNTMSPNEQVDSVNVGDYDGYYDEASNVPMTVDGKVYNGNTDIFQFISPEICYTKDSIKGSLSDYELTLDPVQYICPYVFSTPNIPGDAQHPILINEDNRGGWVVNYGNEYANITFHDPEDKKIIYESGYDALMQDYISASQAAQEVSVTGRNDFQDSLYDIEKRYAYSKLYYTYSGQGEDKIAEEKTKSYNVSSISFPETLDWNDFATSSADAAKMELIYIDKVTNIGGKNFVNWVCGGLYGRIFQGVEPFIHIDWLKDGSYENIGTMGPGGTCAMIRIEDANKKLVSSVPKSAMVSTYICNLKKKLVLPDNQISKKNSIYRSFGDYFSASQRTAYIFNGDCFIQPFEYIAQHKFTHPSSKFWRTACKIFVVPLETSINLVYTSGYEFNKEFNTSSGDITYIQNAASNVNNMFVQDKPLYAYNTAYSTTDTSRSYASELLDDDDVDKMDYRVFHSNVKTNNEYIDSWLKYMPANFLDVDTRKGPITGLRTFKNQLVFWQEYAAGVLSVNERSVISDESNMPLILGSGGVLTRFDYFTNVNGMHAYDYSDAQSNTTLYWWDRINKSIVGYSGGQDAIELSKIKFVQNYLNKNEAEDHPLLAYDNKTKEIVANVVNGEGHENGSLVYNEHLGHFTSLYTIKPEYKVELPDGLLFTTSHGVYDWNKQLDKKAKGLEGEPIYPYLKHVVNHAGQYTKVFDNAEFAGRVYGGDKHENGSYDLSPLKLKFSTPLKQNGELEGNQIENREYNFRYVIPRNNGSEYGDRLRGKTMQCELESTNNSYDFSLQFIKTKFRISWS